MSNTREMFADLDAGRDLLEKDLRKHVIAYAKTLGWRTYFTWTSIHSPRGLPDLVLVRPPRLVFIELKSEKGKVSPEQQEWLDDLAAVPGVVAIVVRPSDWFSGALDGVLR